MVINADKRIKYKEEEVPAGTNRLCACVCLCEKREKEGRETG